MVALCWGTAYFLIHLAIYVLVLRRVPAFRTERGIFLLHFASVCALTATTFLLTLPNGFTEAMTVTAAVAAAHGIYSMSFLELWSLAEGSYSFQILAIVDTMTVADPERVVRELGQVGDQKKVQRLESLRRLGLITRDADILKLTATGRAVARFLAWLQWTANLRDTG